MKRYLNDTFASFGSADAGMDEDAGSFFIDIADDKEKAVSRHLLKCYLIDI